MLSATFLAVFLIPMFFVVIVERFGRRRHEPAAPGVPAAGEPS
jgi:multidrug efflux pump